MKIGILTFHWATNYGAVLQCFALQEALKTLGHEVEVINYKPYVYDNTLWSFLRFRKFLDMRAFRIDVVKEKKMRSFRRRFLRLSDKRYGRWNTLRSELSDYDVLISGSDQVMNPSFLFSGEGGPSSAYFLDINSDNPVRVAYAVSFGTTTYPDAGIKKVKPLISKFSMASTRENSGIAILQAMGAVSPEIVPDPTLLHDKLFYQTALGIRSTQKREYTYAYLLRKRHFIIQNSLQNVLMISDESIENWLSNIQNAEHFITNSFHGVAFSLIFHTPFTVVLQTKENVGMNDRFYSLLEPLGLTDRIISEEEFKNTGHKLIDSVFDWNLIDAKLNVMREKGWDFLKQISIK